jgi:hypothetical protein
MGRHHDGAKKPSSHLFRGSSRVKFFVGGLVFIAISITIFWYQFNSIEIGDKLPSLEQLHWGYLLLILLFMPVETLLAGTRMWMICRVLQSGISFWVCIKADLANIGVAILTPSQTGGGAGQIYILNRAGAKIETALTISLLSFVGSMVTIFGIGVYSLFFTGIAKAGSLFIAAVSTLTFVASLIIGSAFCPGFFRIIIASFSRVFWRLGGRSYPLEEWWPPGEPKRSHPCDRMGRLAARLTDIAYGYHSDVARFLRHGKLAFFCTCFLSLGFFISRFILAFLCLRFLGIQESSLGEVLEKQMALSFLIYLAPTPGSSGVAEGASLSIMTEIVPAGFAPYYNLLWRFSTAYVGAMVGLLLILRAGIQDMKKIYGRQQK